MTPESGIAYWVAMALILVACGALVYGIGYAPTQRCWRRRDRRGPRTALARSVEAGTGGRGRG